MFAIWITRGLRIKRHKCVFWKICRKFNRRHVTHIPNIWAALGLLLNSCWKTEISATVSIETLYNRSCRSASIQFLARSKPLCVALSQDLLEPYDSEILVWIAYLFYKTQKVVLRLITFQDSETKKFFLVAKAIGRCPDWAAFSIPVGAETLNFHSS